MRETWVQSLGWEDPLEKGKATRSSILAWRIPWTVHEVAKSQTRLSNFQKKNEKRPVLLVSLSDVQTKQTTVSEMLSSSTWQTCPTVGTIFISLLTYPYFRGRDLIAEDS